MHKQASKIEDPITLLKTLVSISIGSICWLRNIFPNEAFSSKIYFVPNENKDMTELEKKSQYLKIKTLKKSISKPSDTILTIINDYLFKFIEQNSLKVLIFDVLSNDNTILETYVMDFRFLSTFENDNIGFQNLSVRKSAQMFLKKIFSMTQGLKALETRHKILISVVLEDEIKDFSSISNVFKPMPSSNLKRKNMEFISSRDEDLSKAYCSKFEGGSVSATFSIYTKRNKRKRNARTLTFDNTVYSQRKKKHSIKIVKSNESSHDEIEESIDEVETNNLDTKGEVQPTIKSSLLSCECDSKSITDSSAELFICNGCGRSCHIKCYFASKQIPMDSYCFHCMFQSKNQSFSNVKYKLSENLKSQLTLRKLFNYCSENEIANEISSLIKNVGLPNDETVAIKLINEAFQNKIFLFDDTNYSNDSCTVVFVNNMINCFTINGYDCASPSDPVSKFIEFGDSIRVNIRIRSSNGVEYKKSLSDKLFDNDILLLASDASKNKELRALQELAASAHNQVFQATQLLPETQNTFISHHLEDSDSFSLFDLDSDNRVDNDNDTSFIENSFLKNC